MEYSYKQFVTEIQNFVDKAILTSTPVDCRIVETDEDCSYAPQEDSSETAQYLHVELLEGDISPDFIFTYKIDIIYSCILQLPEIYFSTSKRSKDSGETIHILTFDEFKDSELGKIFEDMNEEQQMAFLTPKYHPISNSIAFTLHECELERVMRNTESDIAEINYLNRWISFVFQAIGIQTIYKDKEFIETVFKD
ncbi:unnamed protein product [Moneuplotes crassus]|uniref:Ubiquitin-like-conjugating enzyme ATG10 n=1 Tax=Euplotes crassus TaxID=5936 RepID=A0AAD2D5C3_EUPCR|nr:unnamed protein product [Moneuplotes crassus]